MDRLAVVLVENRRKLIIKAFYANLPFIPKGSTFYNNQDVHYIRDYNKLLTSRSFWESIEEENILIIQHDSGLLRPGIEEFYEWDYIGAAWNFEPYVGNGGLSFRHKSAMLKIIDNVPYNGYTNEDMYFGAGCKLLGLKLAPIEEANKFSCESQFLLGTLGYHAIERWLTPDQVNQIKTQYSIKEQFELARNTPGDINEHIDTLYNLAQECSHITEMGVRNVVSTWAFMLRDPETLISIDINTNFNVNKARLAYPKWKFIQGDTTKIQIEETDLLFIDTLHSYSQLKKELTLHADKVKKYIVLHDTTTFGFLDEPASFQTPEITGNYKIEERKGLQPAIIEFLNDNPEWFLFKEYTNNNGLTILKRGC